MDPNMLLAWHYYGGGKELLAEDLQGHRTSTSMSFLYGPMPTQPLGWFKKPIAKRRRPARA
jgi:TRAP-type mannitol/chloroaromatic compound transport system substrate-binding protein